MARRQAVRRQADRELLRFVTDAAPLLRLLASRWGNSDRWGVPAEYRLLLRRLADQADRLLSEHLNSK